MILAWIASQTPWVPPCLKTVPINIYETGYKGMLTVYYTDESLLILMNLVTANEVT